MANTGIQSEPQSQNPTSNQEQSAAPESGTSTDESNHFVHLESFDRLSRDLRQAVHRFQEEQTPESFAGIVTALGGFGLSGAQLWRQAARYAQAHPLRVAVYAGVVFFAMRGLMHARIGEDNVH